MWDALLYPITYTSHMSESMVSERKAIEDRLRKKQAEIATLEEKLKGAKFYVQALQDVLKLLSKDDAGEAMESKLRPGSAVAQARDVILERGEPVHLDDILESIGKEVTRESRASLAGSIAAYVRREDIFTRPAPNTFGLVELGHTTIDEEEEVEPPAGFGRQPVAAVDFDEDVPF
jgi:hypothetical protein